jgi:hypothetical protein
MQQYLGDVVVNFVKNLLIVSCTAVCLITAWFEDCNPGGNIFHLAVVLYQVNINFSCFDVGTPNVTELWMSWIVDGLGW